MGTAEEETPKLVSVVVPVLNEAPSLGQLHAEIASVADANGWNLEVVFVDDGSTDRTWAEVTALAATDTRVKGIRFRRNFGKTAALAAGFEVARGEVVITLDGDLQDNPREMPKLMRELERGADLVVGWKRRRRDPWHKVFPSRVFNALVSAAGGLVLHDHNSGYKAMRREVIGELDLYGELHRFITLLAHARGFAVTEVPVRHRPRRYGTSKYGARRFLWGLADLGTVLFITRVGRRPAHFFIALALVLKLLAMLCCLGWFVCWVGGWLAGTRHVFWWFGLAMWVGALVSTLQGVVAQHQLALTRGGAGQYAIKEYAGHLAEVGRGDAVEQ